LLLSLLQTETHFYRSINLNEILKNVKINLYKYHHYTIFLKAKPLQSVVLEYILNTVGTIHKKLFNI
jgi:hypothetical protein